MKEGAAFLSLPTFRIFDIIAIWKSLSMYVGVFCSFLLVHKWYEDSDAEKVLRWKAQQFFFIFSCVDIEITK